MSQSIKSFVNRWAVLISVVYLAATGLLKALAESGIEWAGVGLTVVQMAFGLLALTPDPALAAEVSAGVAGGLALYGATRKVISITKKSRAARG
ncbi:unnamed protein product [marine sediment metagenome]|uniref:Uncharacterized protein n=1 Tax=marine sediment metagenome TaxID=412755 RepID=X0WNZ2_9ZZZZ